MTLLVKLNKNERLTNFSFAEAVWELCEDSANNLDADTVAKMILVQGECENGECVEAPTPIGFH